MTYRAGKENELFCKDCEKKRPVVKEYKKPWWKFW